MIWRFCGLVIVLSVATSVGAQQTIYWKKDHIYVNGKEVAIMTPAPSDQTAPTAPSGLASSNITSTSAQLNWSGSTDSGGSNLAGYKVYRRKGTGASLPVGTVGTGTLTFTDQPIEPSTAYTYTIVAFDNAQNHSAVSNAVGVTTAAVNDTTAPTPPPNLSGHLPTRNSIRVTWNASTDAGGSGINGYKVYRDNVLVSGSTPIPANDFTDTGLAYKTTYTYKVEAVDNAANVSAPTANLNMATDRELLFQDTFDRADTAMWGLGSPWDTACCFSIGFRIGDHHARASAPADSYGFKNYWVNSGIASQPASFKATVTVDWPFQGGNGILFYSRNSGPTDGYRAIMVSSWLYLRYFPNLNDYPGAGAYDVASAFIGTSLGTISVETNATTGEVKIFHNGTLKITTALDPARMSGGVGVTGHSIYNWPYQPTEPALDNFILERN